MKKSNVKLNYFYNLIFQIFSMIMPLITTPYVSRVLSPVGIGQFSFAASINTYFCLIAALGFSIYAQREVAKNQGSIEKQSVIFWEIMICKMVMGGATLLICWGLIMSGQFGNYSFLMKIMSIEIVGIAINITFFFQGNERFGLIVIRDFAIRILGIIVIFVFVKSQDDLWIYALANSVTALVSSISLWACLKKRIVKIKLSNINPFRHFIPSLKLFIPTIAISIYTILDKTLIGVLISGTVETKIANGVVVIERISDIENGFYAQAEKIIKMAMTVIASLGVVMMPRNSRELATGREENFLSNVNKAIEFVFFIGAPMWAGITAVSFNFSPWFFGDGYEKVPYLMCIFAVMIIPAGLGNVLGQQYLIPKGEDAKYAITYIVCAGANLGLNIILIPRYLSYGAAVASVIAEIIAPIIMLYFSKRRFGTLDIIKKNLKSLFASFVMFICVFGTSCFLEPSIFSTFVLIAEGIIIYLILVIVLKCQLVMDVFAIAKRKIVGKNDE